MAVTKIAIRFGDNDFFSTYQGILYTLGEGFGWNIPITDKEYIAEIVNELSYGCYLLFQASRHGIKTKETIEKDRKHYKDYLKITSDRILINEEFDKYFAELEGGWDNSEMAVLEYNPDLPEDFKVNIY